MAGIGFLRTDAAPRHAGEARGSATGACAALIRQAGGVVIRQIGGVLGRACGGKKRRHQADAYWLDRLPHREWLCAAAAGMAFTVLVTQVFYASRVISMVALPAGFAAIPLWMRHKARRKRERFVLQYRDMLYYLSVSLSAGKALEQAFVDGADALALQYGSSRCELMQEMRAMSERLRLREPVERVLGDLAARTGLGEVAGFAEVVAIARHAGGNLVEVVRRSVRVLREQIEVRQEMETAWAAKKLEQRLLCVSPVFLVLLVRAGSGDFMAPMYETLSGRFIMTVALALVGAGYAVGERIMRADP